MFGAVYVDSYSWNATSCVMCAFVLSAICQCACSDIENGFANDQRLRLFFNRAFGVCHSLPPKVADFLEQEGIFHVLEFFYVEDFSIAKEAIDFS